MCLSAAAGLRLGVRTRSQGDEQDASACCGCRRFLEEWGEWETEEHVLRVLLQRWKFWVLFSCSLLDNSFISVAVYYWRGRHIRPLDVNFFCQVNVVNNPKKICGEICLPFISLKLRKRKCHISLKPCRHRARSWLDTSSTICSSCYPSAQWPPLWPATEAVVGSTALGTAPPHLHGENKPHTPHGADGSVAGTAFPQQRRCWPRALTGLKGPNWLHLVPSHTRAPGTLSAQPWGC